MLFFASSKNSTGTEEFRTLRSRLYQLRQQRPLQRVLVTSALPEEGKSFVAANLAQVIVQQQGRTALLVDADLRGSVLHQRLGAPRSPGLGECLKGEAQEWTAIQSGPMENLFFLPAGGPVSNPAELLHSEGLAPLLQRLAASFDWIVIDSPPVVPVSDASLLADLCDGVLLVVQADNTPRDMAQKARQEFRHHAVLGVVLNRAQDNATYHRYYYGGGRPEKDTQG